MIHSIVAPTDDIFFRHAITVEVYARVVDLAGNPVEAGVFAHRAIWSFQNRPVVLGEIIKEHADHFYCERFKQEQVRLRLEGVHNGSVAGRIEFDSGELVDGNRMMEWVNLVCHYRVTHTPRRIRSRFHLNGYGRTYAFETFEAERKAVEVVMVMKSAPLPADSNGAS